MLRAPFTLRILQKFKYLFYSNAGIRQNSVGLSKVVRDFCQGKMGLTEGINGCERMDRLYLQWDCAVYPEGFEPPTF